jgi:hypothetical protein
MKDQTTQIGYEIYTMKVKKEHNFIKALIIFTVAFVIADFFIQNFLSALIYTN